MAIMRKNADNESFLIDKTVCEEIIQQLGDADKHYEFFSQYHFHLNEPSLVGHEHYEEGVTD